MATSEGIPSSIDIEFLELNDNPYNNVRAEAYVMGKMVCAIEDTGFSNVDQIMDKLTTLLPKKISNTRVQFKITNIDKELTQMYQRLV